MRHPQTIQTSGRETENPSDLLAKKQRASKKLFCNSPETNA
jgi:hypothetical protein